MHKKPALFRLNTVPHWVGEGSLAVSAPHFEGHSKVFLLVDENTGKLCLPVFEKALPKVAVSGLLRVKSGEQHKNINTAIDLWKQLTRLQADRDALLVSLGGGVITDIGGFVAATFKRGISFVNVPTTLLGQVDAAIGAKTGIDFENYKNHIGLFARPKAVVIDPVFLQTLPERESRSGFAEIVKYALIMDLPLWKMMAGKTFPGLGPVLSQMMVMSVKDKIAVVEKDEKESGLRKLLNFGHTAGHALETFFMHTQNPVSHGEAVAAGMICATWISAQLSKATCLASAEIYQMLNANFPRLRFSENDIPELLRLMRQDKKSREGEIRFTLLKKLGNAVSDIIVPENIVGESFRFYLRNQ